MRAIDGVAALNPALQNLSNVREAEAPSTRAPRNESVGETTKSYASSTTTDGRRPSDLAPFKPVVGPSDAAEAGLTQTRASARGVDVFL